MAVVQINEYVNRALAEFATGDEMIHFCSRTGGNKK